MARKEDVGTYRVRRGFGGICILQVCIDRPMYCGHVDSAVREYVWVDVQYPHAPAQLKEV